MKATAWWRFMSLLVSVFLGAESCIRRRTPATMPPLETTTPGPWNQTSTIDLTQLPCTAEEARFTECERGTCKVIRVLNDDRQIVRNSYCLCDPGYTAAKCNFPVLPSTGTAGPANIAAGVVIGALLLVSIVIGVVVYRKYRQRSKMEVSQATSLEEEATAPFCSSPTTYSRSSKRTVPGPSQRLQSVSSKESDENENLASRAPLVRQETLGKVPDIVLPNNNSHPVTIESAPLPTPNVQDFAAFGINKDGTSSRSSAQNYAKNTYL